MRTLALALWLVGCEPPPADPPKDTPVDDDGDGWSADEDCDDTNAAVHPGAAEGCGGRDDDCDGLIDAEDPDIVGANTFYADADGDGYGDESAPLQACGEGDGVVANWQDCDDARADVSPGSVEVCDDADTDEDCDGASDDADTLAEGYAVGWTDADGDGHGDPEAPIEACTLPEAAVLVADDCDDTRADIYPDAQEICDDADTDEDCDGAVDDADDDPVGTFTWFADGDGDGWGDAASTLAACALPDGYVADDTDCDDADPAVNPDADELCDGGRDEDCDGRADDDDTTAANTTWWYEDDDGDGYGDIHTAELRCEPYGTRIADATDCDDTRGDVNPGMPEVCDDADTDEDCDGVSDDDDPDVTGTLELYLDSDGDGYGASSRHIRACVVSETAVLADGDCDERDEAVNPGAAEICDDADEDEDCDGLADDDDPDATGQTSWYPDVDADGYGDGTATARSGCDAAGDALAGDCDDADPDVSPDALDECGDNIDADCDDDPTDCTFEGTYPSSSASLTVTGTRYDRLGYGFEALDLGGEEERYLAVLGASELWLGRVPFSRDALVSDIFPSWASEPGSGSALGVGDLDGDGVHDLVATGSSQVGAWYGEPPASGGSVSMDVWIDHVVPEASFGSDVAVADLDRDGTADLLAGASRDPGIGTEAGGVYLFSDFAAHPASLEAEADARAVIHGDASGDEAGRSLATGDLDGDGLEDLLVGAPGASSDAGAVVLFAGADGWGWDRNLADGATIWTGTTTGDRLGKQVCAGPDMDGDGVAEAGSWAEDGAYFAVFTGGVPAAVFVVTATTSYTGIGRSCGLGDFDADGADEWALGTSSPAVLVFFAGTRGGVVAADEADVLFAGAGEFGRALPPRAVDVTGDGIDDLITGDTTDTTGGTSAGKVFIWAGRDPTIGE